MGIYNVRCEHGIMATDCLICSTCSSCAEKDAEIERLTGVIALDCKIMEESSDKLKAAEQKVEAIVAALEIDPTAVNLEAGQLKLIVEAVVKQAKEVNDVK